MMSPPSCVPGMDGKLHCQAGNAAAMAYELGLSIVLL